MFVHIYKSKVIMLQNQEENILSQAQGELVLHAVTKPEESKRAKTHSSDKWCNTPVLTPFALNVHDVYIVINHGVELKAKSPPLI